MIDPLRFDWTFLAIVLGKIAVAFILAMPIAWERERATRIMGLRTFPLVAIASCGYILIALHIAPDETEPHARAIQGLLGGIGFIGGGAILKEGTNVRGTATAASIWTTGAIGAAVGFSRYEIALVLAVVTYLLLRFLSPIEEEIGTEADHAKSEDEGADDAEGG